MSDELAKRQARASRSSWYLYYETPDRPAAVIEVDHAARELEDPTAPLRNVFVNCVDVGGTPAGSSEHWLQFEGSLQDMSYEQFADLVTEGKIVPIIERARKVTVEP